MLHKLSKDSPRVVYMGPDKGPFRCGRCEYFSDKKGGQCQKVTGQIDAYACCNLFQPEHQERATSVHGDLKVVS